MITERFPLTHLKRNAMRYALSALMLWALAAILPPASHAMSTPVPPNAPSGLTATRFSSARLDLSWTDNSADEEGFRVERSPDGATGWALVHTLDRLAAANARIAAARQARDAFRPSTQALTDELKETCARVAAATQNADVAGLSELLSRQQALELICEAAKPRAEAERAAHENELRAALDARDRLIGRSAERDAARREQLIRLIADLKFEVARTDAPSYANIHRRLKEGEDDLREVE